MKLFKAFALSTTSYYLDFALVPAAVAALLWQDRPLEVLKIAAGFLVWTLTEYLIHRWIFHGPTIFEPLHQSHHSQPKALIGIASWGTFFGFLLLWLLIGSAPTAGFMLGYLFYCFIHIRIHHSHRLNCYFSYMKSLHISHHRGGKGNFGVSSPIWDYFFSTLT